jgi:Fur family ferric uptake transcriptional regulator
MLKEEEKESRLQPEKQLRRHKLRVTETRKQILQQFESGEALSQVTLEQQLSGTCDRTTIYRTLKSFEDAGLVHQVTDGTGLLKYALCHGSCPPQQHQHSHAHFRCQQCSTTHCLEGVQVPQVKLPNGFSTSSRELIITGLCPRCQ